MNKTIKLLCTWAAGLLLTGCGSEADMTNLMDWQNNPDAVHFTASLGNATTRTNPAATDNTQTIFNNGDKVTLTNNGNQADYTYNGTSWVPAIADQYLLWDKSNLTFNCWYPADGKNTATVGYLTTDQSSAELIAKSDYMNAEKALQTADEALNFSLDRKTARLVLRISGFTDVPGNIKHVHIVSKASTAVGETNTIDITPFAQNGESEIGGIGTTYTALVAPGQVVAKFYFTDDMSDPEPLTMTTNVTEAGSSYIYNLTVIKRTKIEVTGITAGAWTTASGTTTGDLTPIPYVTFKAEQAQTFKMTPQYGYTISGLEYSVNGGEWKKVVADTGVDFGGDKGNLRLRGTNTNGTASADDPYSTITFDKNVNVACTGDIRTLLDWKNYSTVETQNARFCNLFEGCSVLTSAPELPATKLAESCYSNMFSGCTSLTSAPKLPATTLAVGCYSNMFNGCTSLTSAPTLPAETLANYCYIGMFISCTSLTSAPTLSATTLADYCYSEMFNGCTSLKSAPTLSATTLANSCYRGMFNGCTSLESAPKLPAETLAEDCYCYMFSNCTSLKSAPTLSATTLAKGCYRGMFNGCTNLSSVKMLASKDQITSKDACCEDWLKDAGTDESVTSRTLNVKNQAAYNALKDNSYLPADYWQIGKCTVQTKE